MKHPDQLNDRDAVFNRRLKRVGVTALASYLPATLILGIMQGWDIGEWMVAWTAASIGTFIALMMLFGVAKCPLEREKGQPRKKKGGRK